MTSKPSVGPQSAWMSTGSYSSCGPSDAWIYYGLLSMSFLYTVLGVQLFTFGSLQRSIAESGDGGFYQNLLLVSLLSLLSLHFIKHKALKIDLSAGVLLALLWCALSVFWAIDFYISTRRFVVAALVTVSVLQSVQELGPKRSIFFLTRLGGGALFLDFVAALVLPRGMHQFQEVSGALAGNWRGLHTHKNLAGAFVGGFAVFCWGAYRASKDRLNLYLCILSLLFLWMTQSKTAIAAVVLAFSLQAVLFSRLFGFGPRIMIPLACLLPLSVVIFNLEPLLDLVLDRDSFTGRGAIWVALVSYAEDNLLTGAGFASFWRIGSASPIFQYTDSLATLLGHGHNGYLDILVTTGIVGLLLSVWGFILGPMGRSARSAAAPIVFPVIVFFAAQNFAESSLINVDTPPWFLLIFAIGLLQASGPRRVNG